MFILFAVHTNFIYEGYAHTILSYKVFIWITKNLGIRKYIWALVVPGSEFFLKEINELNVTYCECEWNVQTCFCPLFLDNVLVFSLV